MYGGLDNSPAAVERNQSLLAVAARYGKSNTEASDAMVQNGWSEFKTKRILGLAMESFNVAWRYDPENGDAYHGMAIVSYERDRDAAATEALFKRGLAAKRHGPAVNADYGRFLLKAGRAKNAVPILQQAATTPGAPRDTQALLAIAYAQSGGKANACLEYRKVRPTLEAGDLASHDAAFASIGCR